MKKMILFALIVLILAVATVRPYSGLNAGFAWDWGGIEYRGAPGLFLCAGDYNPATDQYTAYPWATWFPSLVTDC